MIARRRLPPALLAALALFVTLLLLFASPGKVAASSTQESILQDDDQLIYSTPKHMAQTLRQIAALGVDRVKVSMVWWLVAPSPDARRPPRFNATNPAAYPPGAWDRYDMLVRMAHELGLKVYFELSPPNPAWAAARDEPANQGPPLGHAPDRRLFAQFVQAVGRRYSGSYGAAVPALQPSAADLGISSASSAAAGTRAAIPRVDYWGIWNEPNERSWLNPWYRPLPGHKRAIVQAALYRGLFDAAWGALAATGHAGDTILVGETANAGVMTPAAFVRALYCVGAGSRPLKGAAATAVGCPTSGDRKQFVARNPGLFKAAGYAHHPYGFDVAPDRRYSVGTFVTLDNLGAFRYVLNRALAAYGQHPRGGVQLYLTEWGYKTSPPNPFVRTSVFQQQVWLDQGSYMAWQRPWVRALAQFLLVDDKPKQGARKGSAAYWSTFQTGLEYLNGAPKPSYYSFALPIWLPSANHSHVTVWGEVRPAHRLGTVTAQLQYRPSGSASWTTVKEIRTDGVLLAHLSLPGAGSVRLAWLDNATGNTDYSRSAPVA